MYSERQLSFLSSYLIEAERHWRFINEYQHYNMIRCQHINVCHHNCRRVPFHESFEEVEGHERAMFCTQHRLEGGATLSRRYTEVVAREKAYRRVLRFLAEGGVAEYCTVRMREDMNFLNIDIPIFTSTKELRARALVDMNAEGGLGELITLIEYKLGGERERERIATNNANEIWNEIVETNASENVTGDFTCSVCLEATGDEPSSQVCETCHHRFHMGCLTFWLNKSNTCPNCRTAWYDYGEPNPGPEQFREQLHTPDWSSEVEDGMDLGQEGDWRTNRRPAITGTTVRDMIMGLTIH